MKKTIKISLISILVLALIVVICLVGNTSQKNKENEEKYQYALQLAKQEQGYEAAISTLQEIADEYPAAQELINKIRYAEGCKLFNRHEYDEAALKFAETDYDDARELEYACYYFEGIEKISSEKYGKAFGEAISYLKKVPVSSKYGSSADKICKDLYDILIEGQWRNGNILIIIGRGKATVYNEGMLGVEQYQITFPYQGRIEGVYGSSSFYMDVDILETNKISVTGSCTLCSLSGTYVRQRSVEGMDDMFFYTPQDVPKAPYLTTPRFEN